MLTKSEVTWNEEGFTKTYPEAVIFESIFVPTSPLFIENDGTKYPVLSLKYYTIEFQSKTIPICLGQYVNDYGQIDQVIISGTGHEYLQITGIEYSELRTNKIGNSIEN